MNTRHTFDPEQKFEKRCEFGKQPVYMQEGRLFDAGYNYIGKADDPTDTPAEREHSKESIRQSAHEKISKALEGFKTPDRPSVIEEAMSENATARQAEEHAE